MCDDHRDLHVLTHPFPTRRSSDLGSVDHDAAKDLVVGASELLANAIDASPGGATVALRGTQESGAVVLEAINRVSEWVSPAERWDMDDPLRTGGRGLDRKSTRLNSSH